MAASSTFAPASVAKTVQAYPTKDFFVTMITKDIALRDCIFDLLDNSIDGAHREAKSKGNGAYAGFEVRVTFDATRFSIGDNCGGITLDDAIHHAFHFGRKVGASNDVAGGIGLYGIGMKRAIFKIGRKCAISSQASDAAFKVSVDVEAWKAKEEWDFEYEDIPRATEGRGTLIEIGELTDGARQLLGDPAFRNSLVKDMARDYAFFIQKGLTVKVCDQPVPSYQYRLSSSANLAPMVETYDDDGVAVRILAGIADSIPDDVPEDLRPDKVERLGWFIICNDRVVLAADKTERTVWGNDGYNVWHGQYAGFAGYVFFNSADQSKLPWNTTKRGIDLESPLYRRAVARMKSVTTEFIKYSQVRSGDLAEAKNAERQAQFVEISQLRVPQPLRLPTLSAVAVRPSYSTISYQKPKTEIDEVRQELGSSRLTLPEVGRRTFEYYRRVELGKK